MNIPMCSKIQQMACGAFLTVGILLSPFQMTQAQERVYPPEPEPIGIHLTPLENIQSLEADLMLAVAANKPTANKGKNGVQPSKSTVKPVKQENLTPPTEATKAPSNNNPTLKSDSSQSVTSPLPAVPPSPTEKSNAERPTGLLDTETMSLKPQTPMPTVKGTPLENVTTFLQKHVKQVNPLSYSPLEAIVIFPVIKHGREKAFGDLSVIFAREMALRLESAVPKTRVYNPVYTVDELRVRGLGHVYDQIMGYYLKAGRPEPKATDYMLKQLSMVDGKTISRVIFVEADLDTNHLTQQSGVFDRINGWLTDATLKQMKYFINSRLQVFDAENPNLPMVWGGSWRRSIKTNQFANITPSVFTDSDSQQSFAGLSREMSREILWFAPKAAYMAPQFDLSVQGQLASKKEAQFPALTGSPTGKNRMDEANRQAIQRILQRQNMGNP